MALTSALTLTATHYEQVRKHLFPGDGLEAAAILICARVPEPRVRLIVRKILLVPHAACQRREPDWLTWPGDHIEQAIDLAEDEQLSLVLLHSHPGGLFGFSDADDKSDQITMPGLNQAIGALHGSAIMTHRGAMMARVYDDDLQPQMIDLVSVADQDLQFWWSDGKFCPRPQAFTKETRDEMARLTACVVGVSGTGSIIAEQAARLGFGEVLLIDFDKVEDRNLNRILNSTTDDVSQERAKVESFAEAISRYRGPGVAKPLRASISARDAVLMASQADVIFSCVDTLEARHIADLISSSFLLPLLDVGVVIPTRNALTGPVIADVCGRIDYVFPGGATLTDRGVYSPESLRAEYLRRVAPEAHDEERQAGYIKGLPEEAPSVITLNMRAASACMMEFIARAYPFRHYSNSDQARTTFSLAGFEEEKIAESEFPQQVSPVLSRGSKEPLLGLPDLRPPRRNS